MEKISHYINEIIAIQQDMRSIFYQEEEEEEGEEPQEEEEETLTEDEIIVVLECMAEYIKDHPTLISNTDFNDVFLEEMQTFFPCCKSETMEQIIELFHTLFYPKRSQQEDEPDDEETEILDIKDKIDYLHSQPQHIQRTPEWYDFRNNLITASNAYKVFETNASRNQLIYEKCNAFEKREKNIEDIATTSSVNVESSLHWGQKYERVSVLIYEKNVDTNIEEFGCIKHSVYDFLGASPDGIITNPVSPKYGRMLEIKNIVNREIDGIPKKEYWIQMQLQMEVCNLNECDFLETQFIEYENESDFLNDYEIDADCFTQTGNGELKGIIMYFSKDGIPTYIYKPLDMNKSEFDVFEADTIEKMEETGMVWIKNMYWKLKTYSCVVVKRNRRWFQDVILDIQDLWNIIKRERVEGYSHRAPNKRRPVVSTVALTQESKCLISINDGKTHHIHSSSV